MQGTRRSFSQVQTALQRHVYILHVNIYIYKYTTSSVHFALLYRAASTKWIEIDHRDLQNGSRTINTNRWLLQFVVFSTL